MMFTRIQSLLTASLLCAAFFVALPMSAYSQPFRPRVDAIGSELWINGQVAIDISGPSGRSRVTHAASRLKRTGAEPVELTKISRHKWAVTTELGSIVLLITRADGYREGMTVRGLADLWAARINALLKLPPIEISRSREPLVAPVDGSRSLRIDGAARADQIMVRSEQVSVATAIFDGNTRTLTVRGISPGIASIEMVAGDGDGGTAQKTIMVIVENQAGTIEPEVEATVTGSPTTPRDVVLQAARTALCRGVNLEPSALLEVIDGPDVEHGLQFGATETLTADVRAVGSDLIPVERVVQIRVRNDSSFTQQPAQLLYYSNNPETVKRPQNLFTASMPTANRPMRLVYHHQNVTNGDLLIRVEIDNLGHSAASIHIIRGMSVADPDPVAAGTRAGSDFFRDWRSNSGEDIDIPAQTRLEIVQQNLRTNEVSSGVIDVNQISGDSGGLMLRITAEASDEREPDGLHAVDQLPDPETTAFSESAVTDGSILVSTPQSDQIYDTPSVDSSGLYVIGSPWPHINIGTRDAVSRAVGDGSALAGNYGVIYSISLVLTNPTAVSRVVTVAFESEAGTASGIFTIGGNTIASVTDLPPSNEQELTRALVPAGATKTIEIQTIPLSGSAYPASIVAHAL